ncbi:MAG: class I SAM-dependent methyltransferase [Gemmatimonadetes bacterium]|nr:class I SAM-dependent methyltransferase [Gemmatimonadota bacterium]
MNLSGQYGDSRNLRSRVSLHANFSTNKVDWSRWVFERLGLKADSRVLEVGCGTGELWKRNLPDVPPGCVAVLSDLFHGMASEARDRLAADGRFTTCVCDAQALPFPEETFDLVVANHMLYHVPDRRRGLGEIWRVLKPGGRLMAATNGLSHMRELFRMLDGVSPGRKTRPVPVEEGFSLQDGAGLLGEWFTEVAMTRRDDSLEVTEAGPVVAYGLSTGRYDLSGNRAARLAELVEKEIAANGRFRITKETGLFEARKQRVRP